MKRRFTKYPSNIYSAKHIKYETTHMTFDGETPQELIDILNSIISTNNLHWFYGIEKVEVHWGHPFPTIVCILDDRHRLIGTAGGSSDSIQWEYSTTGQSFISGWLREIADSLDILNNSSELNDLIINFEEYYGEEE